MSAVPAPQRQTAGWHADAEWAQIHAAAPRVAAVMRRYMRQLGTFLAPRSADAADGALRQFARWMLTEAGITAVGDIHCVPIPMIPIARSGVFDRGGSEAA